MRDHELCDALRIEDDLDERGIIHGGRDRVTCWTHQSWYRHCRQDPRHTRPLSDHTPIPGFDTDSARAGGIRSLMALPCGQGLAKGGVRECTTASRTRSRPRSPPFPCEYIVDTRPWSGSLRGPSAEVPCAIVGHDAAAVGGPAPADLERAHRCGWGYAPDSSGARVNRFGACRARRA